MTSSNYGNGGNALFTFTDVGGTVPSCEQPESDRIDELDYVDRVDAIDHGSEKPSEDAVEEPGEMVPAVVGAEQHCSRPEPEKTMKPLNRGRWIVYKDVTKPGYRNPGPPEQPGAYIGQVVIVPAVPDSDNLPA